MLEQSQSSISPQELSEKVVYQVEKAITGKRESIRQAVLTLLANGHMLLEDIPGVGKTTLAKAIAQSIGGEFRRIQFTPDLLPTDITGAAVYSQKDQEFHFRPGPVFGNVVLVDEVNRATPKTQSALLEAMEERQVSADGQTRPLPKPFLVIATQNNLEMTGTYPLPEAQLDRFFSRISLGYPDRQAEADILQSQQFGHPLQLVDQCTTLEELQAAQAVCRSVHLHESIRFYIVDLVRATREHALLLVGSSPRGALFLALASQVYAAMRGSNFVRPDDVKAVAGLVLSHRIIARSEVQARGTTNLQIVEQILASVPAPLPVE